MTKKKPFLGIGTVGIITTALLHICLTFFINGNNLQIAFFVAYSFFICLLLIGMRQLIKEQQTGDNNRWQ